MADRPPLRSHPSSKLKTPMKVLPKNTERKPDDNRNGHPSLQANGISLQGPFRKSIIGKMATGPDTSRKQTQLNSKNFRASSTKKTRPALSASKKQAPTPKSTNKKSNVDKTNENGCRATSTNVRRQIKMMTVKEENEQLHTRIAMLEKEISSSKMENLRYVEALRSANIDPVSLINIATLDPKLQNEKIMLEVEQMTLQLEEITKTSQKELENAKIFNQEQINLLSSSACKALIKDTP